VQKIKRNFTELCERYFQQREHRDNEDDDNTRKSLPNITEIKKLWHNFSAFASQIENSHFIPLDINAMLAFE
jgi:hypothetical protein